MTGTPQIDDRRRFKELRKELVVRAAAGLLAGAAALLLQYAILHLLVVYYSSQLSSPMVFNDIEALRSRLRLVARCILIATISPVWALPSVVVKRGRAVFPVVGLLAAAGMSVGTLAGVHNPAALTGVLLGVVGAALGLAEGMLERSTAAIYAGLMGGAFMGALLGLGHRAYLDCLASGASTFVPRLLASSLLFAGLHLSIGLTLALGRWVRDLPKRKTEGGEPTEGEPREEHQRILPLFASSDEEFVVRFDRCSIAGNVMSYLGVCMPGVGMPGCGEPASWCYHSTACEREQIDCMYAKGEAWPFESDMMLQAIPDHAIKAMHDDFDCLIDLLVRLEAVREGSPEEADILSSLRAHADLSFETRKEWEEWGTSQAGKHNYSDWPLSVPGPTMPKPEWADGEPTE